MTQPTGAPVSAARDVKRRTRLRERLQTNGAAIVVAAAFALVAGVFAVDDPERIPELTIDNPTAYDIRIEVSDETRAAWTVLTTARQRCTATVDSPVDNGDTWTVRMHAQGKALGEATVPRDELERAGWRFTIPQSVAQGWEAEGIPHPPRQSC